MTTRVCPFVKAAFPDDSGSAKKAANAGSETAREDSGDTVTLSPKCPFGYHSQNFVYLSSFFSFLALKKNNNVGKDITEHIKRKIVEKTERDNKVN